LAVIARQAHPQERGSMAESKARKAEGTNPSKAPCLALLVNEFEKKACPQLPYIFVALSIPS